MQVRSFHLNEETPSPREKKKKDHTAKKLKRNKPTSPFWLETVQFSEKLFK